MLLAATLAAKTLRREMILGTCMQDGTHVGPALAAAKALGCDVNTMHLGHYIVGALHCCVAVAPNTDTSMAALWSWVPTMDANLRTTRLHRTPLMMAQQRGKHLVMKALLQQYAANSSATCRIGTSVLTSFVPRKNWRECRQVLLAVTGWDPKVLRAAKHFLVLRGWAAAHGMHHQTPAVQWCSSLLLPILRWNRLGRRLWIQPTWDAA